MSNIATQFQFDTSGSVLVQRASSGGPFEMHWSNLSPFVQGYVEALFADLLKRKRGEADEGRVEKPMAAHGLASYRAFGRFSDVAIGARTRHEALSEALRSRRGVTLVEIDVWDGERYVSALGFSDLASESLARIMEDCERLHPPTWHPGGGRKGGGALWTIRQRGKLPDFPPLTPYLNDAGKVCLREAV